MKIQKSTTFLGKYVAHERIGKYEFITGMGRTHMEAINDCLMMLGWVDPKYQVNRYPDSFISEQEAELPEIIK